MFSGDAPTSLLTMSGLANRSTRRGPSRSFATFFINPYGLTRSLVLTVGRDDQGGAPGAAAAGPRRGTRGSAATAPTSSCAASRTSCCRDLNAGLIADQMMAGAPSIYCDFTDYDEIAHHAGPTRPESLASLAGHRPAHRRPRDASPRRRPAPYRFVVLSDHGQSQGATFLQRYGMPLQDLVRQLMGSGSVAASTGLDETVGPVNTFLTQVGQQGGATGKLARARGPRTRTRIDRPRARDRTARASDSS